MGTPESKPAGIASESKPLGTKDILGYLAVPTEDVQDILKRGYVLSTKLDTRTPPKGHATCHTSRIAVPFAIDYQTAVAMMRTYRRDVELSTMLEIRRVAADGTMIPEDRICKRDGNKYEVKPDPVTGVLDKKFLSMGLVYQRGKDEYAEAPCPYCKEIPQDASLRGKVGVAQFVRNAYMVVPCRKEECIKAQEDRQQRLNNPSTKMTLYHGCSKKIMESILKCGGKFIRGKVGEGGGGIYFAHTPREVEWKAEHMNPDGVVLECEVSLGHMMKGGHKRKNTTFADLVQAEGGPYDSLCLDRGKTGYDDIDFTKRPFPGTRIEDVTSGKFPKTHPGYEWIVFSWDQVKVLGTVPRDPVPKDSPAPAAAV